MRVGAHEILVGDVRDRLGELPEGSVRCVVTSPPYWGLRDYGVDGQIGLEATPEAYVASIVEVFRAVRRVLAEDGTLWLNLGDCYASTPPGNTKTGVEKWSSSGLAGARSARYCETLDSSVGGRRSTLAPGLKPKDLVGVPWMVAFALRADGWFLRQDIVWHKPNPMPESVRDRCTKAHEYVFLMSKSQSYYYNQDATLEPCSPNTNMRVSQEVAKQLGSKRAHGGNRAERPKAVVRSPKIQKPGSGIKNNQSFIDAVALPVEKRNKRSVWTITTKPFKGAHFATFPEDLVEPCVLAGSEPGDHVLDPFGGSGTVGAVCERLGRRAVLIELNPEYASMAERRIGAARDRAGMFALD